ncbi:MAG TPA: LysR family transcriptional regulator [Burkholderiaceae bacterium]|nr:LysR family transcriptional regulator [Burkholderiaceae bacterium]
MSRHLTVRQLEVLAAVGREGSVTAAAESLHLTQPAVSMQLRQLERQLELTLFETVGRRLQITEPGKELVQLAVELLARIDDLEQTARSLRGVGHGRVRLGVVSTAKYFAPRLLAQFVKLHSGVEFKLTIHNRAEIIDQLQSYAIDLGIMGQPPEGMQLDGTAFAPNPLVAIAAPSHPLSLRRRLNPHDLTDQPFIVRESGSGTRSAMDRYLVEHDVKIRRVMEADSNETIKQAVMAGIGLGFVSLHTVRAELAAGRIAVLDVSGLPLQRQWYAVHSRQRRLTPAAEEFLHYLLREADALMRAAL